jgi:hypothetical protein
MTQQEQDAFNALTGATIKSIGVENFGIVIVTTSGLKFSIDCSIYSEMMIKQEM